MTFKLPKLRTHRRRPPSGRATIASPVERRNLTPGKPRARQRFFRCWRRPIVRWMGQSPWGCQSRSADCHYGV